jgi:MFS superfamily sulfate permease-like transporter
MLGVTVDAPDAVQRAIGIIAALPGTHAPTLLLSAAVLALVLGLRRLAPSVPAAFVACAAAIALSAALDLPAIGVAVLGAMPAALPGFALPDVPLAALFAQRFPLAEHAMGIALISFASFMIPARAFAARRGETTDADREAVSLGLCHAVAGAAQGFPVSASSTRTAVAEAAGSQGPACALVAAGAMAVAMATLSTPLAFLPRGAMAALLVQAALSLLDAAALRALWRFDRGEAALAVVATLGVLVAGPLNAVLISVALAILRFIRITARPSAEVLGRVPGLSGFHGIMRNPEARVEPGLVLFRFNAPLVFFNAPAFMRTALAAGEAPGTRWFVLDLYPITQIDSTGLAALLQVRRQLAARGVHVAFAGRLSEALAFLQAQGLRDPELAARFFPTLRAALRAYRAALSDGAALRQAVDTGFDTATALHKLGHESTAPSQHRDLRDPH